MKFFLLSDNIDTCVGMRLAGIEGVVVHKTDEVIENLKKIFSDSNIGVVLMTHKVISLCPEYIYELKLKAKRPLIVEIADRHGEGQISDSITKYVREAIGINI
ncbi:MAG TPA: ATP synthase subunit F [Ruminococcaceae bacterium]|nr:ATP synthase subunit F [Oscillospiraceae bacterium]